MLAPQGLRAPEVPGMLGCGAQRDRVGVAVVLGLDVGDAEVLPPVEHRVLLVQQEVPLSAPGLPGAPLAGDALSLEPAVGGDRERQPVVLVRLRDDPLGVGPQEVDRQPEMDRGQVGEAVRGHLVGDVEGLLEVLDADVALPLGLAQQLDRGLLGREHRGREVVRLDPLPEVVAEVRRVRVLQREVAERLQDHRPRLAHLHVVLVPDVDHPVAGVGYGAGRPGEPGHTLDAEAVAANQLGEDPFADRARAGVAGQREPLGGDLLDVGEVVVPVAHLVAQLRVGPAGALGGVRGACGPFADGPAESDEVLEDVVAEPRRRLEGGQPQLPVGRLVLDPQQGQLQLCPAVGRGVGEQVGGRGPQGVGEVVQYAETGLDPPVLEPGQVGGRSPRPFGQVREGESLASPGVAQPAAEHEQVGFGRH